MSCTLMDGAGSVAAAVVVVAAWVVVSESVVVSSRVVVSTRVVVSARVVATSVVVVSAMAVSVAAGAVASSAKAGIEPAIAMAAVRMAVVMIETFFFMVFSPLFISLKIFIGKGVSLSVPLSYHGLVKKSIYNYILKCSKSYIFCLLCKLSYKKHINCSQTLAKMRPAAFLDTLLESCYNKGIRTERGSSSDG
jgi:hypothetical protein